MHLNFSVDCTLPITAIDSRRTPVNEAAPPRTECAIVTEASTLQAITDDWYRLWSLDPNRQIFQHPGWIRAWLDAYATAYRLFTPVVSSGAIVRGVLPLVLCGRTLRFLGFSNSDYNTLIAAPEAAASILTTAIEALDTRKQEWDVLLLENVPEESLLARAIDALPNPLRARFQRGPASPCPTLIFGDDKERILSNVTNKDKLRKAARYLERSGPTQFRHLETPADAAQHLPLFLRQHIRRQSLAGRRSQYLTENGARFCEALFEHLNPERELRFSVLETGGHPVAYHLGFELDGKYLFYKPTFDVDKWDLSPGQVLLFHLFRYLQTAPSREFDFSLGGESYKYRFANSCRSNHTFRVHAPTVRGRIHQAGYTLIDRAKRSVRSRPALDEKVMGVADWFATVQQAIQRDGIVPVARMLSQQHFLSTKDDRLYELTTLPTATQHAVSHIQTASLADLADCADEAGPVYAARLHIARERLKRQCRAYMVCDMGALAQVAWILVAEGAYAGISLSGQASTRVWVIEECWQHHGYSSDVRIDLLHRIASDAAADNATVWVIAHRPSEYNSAFWMGVLQLKTRMVAWRWFPSLRQPTV